MCFDGDFVGVRLKWSLKRVVYVRFTLGNESTRCWLRNYIEGKEAVESYGRSEIDQLAGVYAFCLTGFLRLYLNVFQ